jgi:hypothetical protein
LSAPEKSVFAAVKSWRVFSGLSSINNPEHP